MKKKGGKLLGIAGLLIAVIGSLVKYLHLPGANLILVVGATFILGHLITYLLDRLSISISVVSMIGNLLASVAAVMILYSIVGKVLHFDFANESFIAGGLLFLFYYFFYAQRSDLRRLELRSDRQLACILFTDIVGYTAIMGENEAKAMKILDSNRRIQQPLIRSHQGKWLKEIGDGTLSIFFTASDAVMCAIAIMEKARQDGSFRLRMGIHLGEIVFTEKDILGDGVNVASRIMDQATDGGICLSEAVYHNIRNKESINTQLLGEFDLKNVNGKMRLYKIEIPAAS